MLRVNRALQALLGSWRFPTDSTIWNLFTRFTQGMVVGMYEPLWAWQLERDTRADTGYFAEELLKYLEEQKLAYIVVARLTHRLEREAARVKEWRELDATCGVGEFRLRLWGWDWAQRFVVVGEQMQERKPSLGRKLFEVLDYMFRVFMANLEDPSEQIWRDYNQRACMEQRIEELKSDLAADDFCRKEFFATEAAFLAILMLFNLLGEFQRATGMTGYRRHASLRVRVFLCRAILGRAGDRAVLHLSSARGGLEKHNPLFDKLLHYEIRTSCKLEIQPRAAA